jgi:hypothetical protein
MSARPVIHKFVAVLNKKVPVGTAMNALAHAAAGLSASYDQPELMRFDDYQDKDDGVHPAISDNPFIILRADNSNKLRTLREQALAAGIHCNDFTSTMTSGTFVEQQERTKATPEAELEYYAVCLFGEIEQLNALTKKFSLWRD